MNDCDEVGSISPLSWNAGGVPHFVSGSASCWCRQLADVTGLSCHHLLKRVVPIRYGGSGDIYRESGRGGTTAGPSAIDRRVDFGDSLSKSLAAAPARPDFQQSPTPAIMRLLPTFGLVASLASHVSATALTYKLMPHEKACFYANANKVGEKVAFYFAVSC